MDSPSPTLLETSELNSPHSLRASAWADDVESGIETVLRGAEARVKAASENLRREIRRYPERSVIAAAAGGYLFHRLPVGALLATGVKLAAAFTPPTLIALGICKMAEYCKRMDRATRETGVIPGDSVGRIVATDAV